MDKVLEITEDKVLEAIEECPESADVLKTLFPDVVEAWAHITTHAPMSIGNGYTQWDIYDENTGKDIGFTLYNEEADYAIYSTEIFNEVYKGIYIRNGAQLFYTDPRNGNKLSEQVTGEEEVSFHARVDKSAKEYQN